MSPYHCQRWSQSCWRICTPHQSTARAEAAAALQSLSRARGKSTPICGTPGHCSVPGVCPCSSGFGTSRSLPSPLIHPGLVVTCAVPVLVVAGGEGHTRAVFGALLGLWSRCHPGAAPCHRRCSSCSSCRAQPGHRTSTAVSKHGSVPPGLLSAHAAPSVPQSKPLTPGRAWGRW